MSQGPTVPNDGCPHDACETSSVEDSKGPRVVSSDHLLRGARELFILHHGETYRLMETRNGKLILQK